MVITGYRETFKKTFDNAAQWNAGTSLAFQDQTNAQVNKNIPHNVFFINNQDSSSFLFVFLDRKEDENKPDYVVLPNSTFAAGLEDGLAFTTLHIKNSHATNNIAANLVKVRIATLKKETEVYD